MLSIDRLAETIALVGATVHSMVPGEEPRVATLLIEDGRIAALEEVLPLPPDCIEIDLSGKHIVPGLIDGFAYHDRSLDYLHTMYGVTTLREHGNDLATVLLERDPVERNRNLGPSLSISGALVDGTPPATTSAMRLDSVDDADSILPTMLEERVDFVAIGNALLPEVRTRVLELAAERGLQVWGALPKTLVLRDILSSGQGGLLYLDGFLPASIAWTQVKPVHVKASAVLSQRAGLRVMPLLRATARLLDEPDDLELVYRWMGPTYEYLWRNDLEVRRLNYDDAKIAEGRVVLDNQRMVLKALHDAGVVLVPGSGAPQPWLVPGVGFHQELQEWQSAGIPPADILRYATQGAAAALGLDGDRGTIAIGKRADLVVVDQDPRSDIGHLMSPATVVLRGLVLGAEQLAGMRGTHLERMDQAREMVAKPMDVALPVLPEGEVLVEGYTELQTAVGRASAERFAVVDVGKGKLAFCGHKINPQGVHVEVQQTYDRRGILVDFKLTLLQGAESVGVEGIATAGQTRIRRTRNGIFVDNRSIVDPVAALDIGSVTSLMAIGHFRKSGAVPMLTFAEGLELSALTWRLRIAEDGRHVMDTNTGLRVITFGDAGEVELSLQNEGNSVARLVTVEVETGSGPGLPLPDWKLADIVPAAAEVTDPDRDEGEEPEEGPEGASGGGPGEGTRGGAGGR